MSHSIRSNILSRNLLLKKVVSKINQSKKEDGPNMIALELSKLFEKYLELIKKCLNRHGFLTRVTNLKHIEKVLHDEVNQYQERCHKVKFLDICEDLKKNSSLVLALDIDNKVKDQEERIDKFKKFKKEFFSILKEMKFNLLKIQAKDPNKEIDIKGILATLAELHIDLSY